LEGEVTEELIGVTLSQVRPGQGVQSLTAVYRKERERERERVSIRILKNSLDQEVLCWCTT
jgi:hypothetical protein